MRFKDIRPRGPERPAKPQTDALHAVELVVASTQRENTSWVHRNLPDWSHSIYVVDDASAMLTVPQNKGREAMVYLTHIIDRYDSLASITVFVHAARFAWHNDDPDYDVLATFRNLRLDYVQSAGYVNLRCVWALGCPEEIRPELDALDRPYEAAIRNRQPGQALTTKRVYKQAFQELMPGVPLPSLVGVACCSQFAVSRDAIRSRPREDYVRWRTWLLETELTDDLSGRVLEYMWHIIFGKTEVHCPNASDCYCKVYGLCNLRCDANQCDKRYLLPKVATLPSGWPNFGWDGEERSFSGPPL
ncbi:hypothetical protein QBC34DRAFT_410452 [Podospora aff. communis PSN243]|uniref:Uncharacterized protein n=1 Tax=Podospora aff. communis PSN243 TaxID=3040156 RepID=A0AAV9GJC2_9PEZI|nr:hypothetical protein QBC34DRAFT_410452 [Podospora aff. communis PSN243]